MKIIIKNAMVPTEEYQNGKLFDVLIVDNTIAEINDKLDYDCDLIIDAECNYVLPGLIDMHCNICDPGMEHYEDMESASNAALKGGYTSITVNPNTLPAVDNKTVVQYLVSKSKYVSKANIYPYGSMTKSCKGTDISEIGEMKNVGIVAVSDGDYTVNNADTLRKIFQYTKMFDLPVITHCEDIYLKGAGVINEGYYSTRMGLSGIPAEAEEIIVARNLVLASHIKNKLHLANITTRGSVELIRDAKSRGVPVTAETNPRYFTLTEEDVSNYNTLAKVNPPLRTKKDAESLIEGLIDGTIDVISSGHSPSSLEQKEVEFDKASNGFSSLETSFVVSFDGLFVKNKMTLYELINKMSANPAKILNLKNKGAIKAGYDADIIIVDHKNLFKIDSSRFASKVKFSPYNGKKFRGKVLHTIVNGIRIF